MGPGVFQTIVENSSALVFLVDEEGKILYSNPAIEQLLGRQSHEVIGSSFFMMIHPEERNQLQKLWQGCLTTSQPLPVPELRCSHCDGSPRILAAILSNYLHDKNIGAVLIEAYDLTKRVLQEERERSTQKQQALARLASKTAHDLNNALATIFGFADLLRPNLSPSSLEELDEIIYAGQRVAVLVDHLSVLAKSDPTKE
jgi:PAS domain S-box-containing protein